MNLSRLLPTPLFLNRLRVEVRNDPLPAAVLWVEMAMRPLGRRMLEYLSLLICKMVAPQRGNQLTVGLAQMKVWLWNEFMQEQLNRVPSIEDWENPVLNYYAVKWYLMRHGVSNASCLDISRVYTGQTNKYYAALLDEALLLLQTRYGHRNDTSK